MIRRLRADRRAASAVEFALLAPALLSFIFLLIEGALLEWRQQALQQVASESVRCFALGASGCETPQATQAYASALAQQRGIPAPPNSVTVSTDQTCSGANGMNKVTIVVPISLATSLLPQSLSTLNANSCFVAPN